MGNYENSSLQERIERRRKQRRAATRRRLIIFLIIVALIVGGVFASCSLFSDDNTDDPVEVVDGDVENTPETETQPEDETPTDEPADEPETAPEDEPVVEEPEVEPDINANEEPEDIPLTGVPTAGNVPFSFNAVKGAELLAKHSVEIMSPIMLATYTQIRAKLLKPEVDPDKPMVALTFDDGPSGKYGGRILDALEKNGARASFFVLGELVNGNSANLKRAYEMGCEIGNHSYDHPTLTKLSEADIKSQYSKTSDLVKAATGAPTALARTPGGAVNKTVKAAINMPIINWSLDTVDWKSKNCDAIVKIVLDNVRDGDIILMHEIYKTSAEAAEIIIPELIKRGYQLVTVSEMMEAREVTMEPGKVYFSAYPKKKAE